MYRVWRDFIEGSANISLKEMRVQKKGVLDLNA